MRLAAIDIGSNAARLLIVDVVINYHQEPEFDQVNFIRLPLRLGFEVFENGEISDQKLEKVVMGMQVFQDALNFYDVKSVKTCATSAMRDAKNSKKIIETVEQRTGIKINIISGDEEALMVNFNHIADHMDKRQGYLYADVGGGSTELIFFVEGKIQYKESINIGTIRLLKNTVKKSDWDHMKAVIKDHVKSHLPYVAIGSGGNINKIFSLSKKKEGKPLTLELLNEYHENLSKLSVKERIRQYKLREDRADVIVPALEIFINVMRWAGIEEIYVPEIGVVDGLVRALYAEVVNAHQ